MVRPVNGVHNGMFEEDIKTKTKIVYNELLELEETKKVINMSCQGLLVKLQSFTKFIFSAFFLFLFPQVILHLNLFPSFRK